MALSQPKSLIIAEPLLQLMLSKFEYDGKLNPNFQTGAFQLPLGRIWGYPTEPQAPRFVLISSAGVTRPGRYLCNFLSDCSAFWTATWEG